MIKKYDHPPQMLKNLLIMSGCFFVMLISAALLAEISPFIFGVDTRSCYLSQSFIQNLIGFCGTSLACAYFISRNPLHYLGLTEYVSWRPFAGIIILYIFGLPAMNQMIYYNSQMHLPECLAGVEAWMKNLEELNGHVTETILSTTTVDGLISGILIIGVITGISEELLFRGTLQNILTRDSGIGKWGIWIAAFIFSAVHLQFYGFFPRLLLGAFFGYLFYSTGSIYPAIFAHALNNSIVVIGEWLKLNNSQFSFDESIGVTECGFPGYAFSSMLAVILFFIFGYNFFFNGNKKCHS